MRKFCQAMQLNLFSSYIELLLNLQYSARLPPSATPNSRNLHVTLLITQRVWVIRELRPDLICTDRKSLLLKEKPQISIFQKECFLPEVPNQFHLYLYSLSSPEYTDVPLCAPLSQQTLREALKGPYSCLFHLYQWGTIKWALKS